MPILPRKDWTPEQDREVARIILDPACNGGTETTLTVEDVAAAIPDAPAWAVFDGEDCTLVVGLNPYEEVEPGVWRGILHFARRATCGPMTTMRVLTAFIGSLEGIQVFAFSPNYKLSLLAQRAGLHFLKHEDGFYVLGK